MVAFVLDESETIVNMAQIKLPGIPYLNDWNPSNPEPLIPFLNS